MDFEEYQAHANRTRKTDSPDELVNYLFGLVGEVGELVNCLKKHLYHGHDFNFFEVQTEAGDILWYLSAILSTLNLNFEDVAVQNVIKLQKRYPNGFNVEDSRNRKED